MLFFGGRKRPSLKELSVFHSERRAPSVHVSIHFMAHLSNLSHRRQCGLRSWPCPCQHPPSTRDSLTSLTCLWGGRWTAACTAPSGAYPPRLLQSAACFVYEKSHRYQLHIIISLIIAPAGDQPVHPHLVARIPCLPCALLEIPERDAPATTFFTLNLYRTVRHAHESMARRMITYAYLSMHSCSITKAMSPHPSLFCHPQAAAARPVPRATAILARPPGIHHRPDVQHGRRPAHLAAPPQQPSYPPPAHPTRHRCWQPQHAWSSSPCACKSVAARARCRGSEALHPRAAPPLPRVFLAHAASPVLCRRLMRAHHLPGLGGAARAAARAPAGCSARAHVQPAGGRGCGCRLQGQRSAVGSCVGVWSGCCFFRAWGRRCRRVCRSAAAEPAAARGYRG